MYTSSLMTNNRRTIKYLGICINVLNLVDVDILIMTKAFFQVHCVNSMPQLFVLTVSELRHTLYFTLMLNTSFLTNFWWADYRYVSVHFSECSAIFCYDLNIMNKPFQDIDLKMLRALWLHTHLLFGNITPVKSCSLLINLLKCLSTENWKEPGPVSHLLPASNISIRSFLFTWNARM